MGVTVVSKMNVREGEEEVTVHSSSTAVKGHQMSVPSRQEFQNQTKVITYLDNKRLWNSLSGVVEDDMALHQVLKGFGEIAGRKIPLTPTRIL